MIFYQIFCSNCGMLFLSSQDIKFADRSANILCCSKNCLKIHNYKYSAWTTRQKIDFKCARDVITTTIKIVGNIPEINELLKLSSSLVIDEYSNQQLLKEIIEMIKDNIILL